MEESRPLVSIIVRTKDRPKLLKRALQSIASQTYRPIEIVLVNDGGCDLDIEELKSILGDISLNYRRLEKNTGRAHAGNVGIEHAKGKYVGFLDDDDEFYPHHLETLAGKLATDDYYKIVYSDSYLTFHEPAGKSDEFVITKKDCFYSEDFDRDRLLFENYIPLLCLLFAGDVLLNFSFEEDLPAHEDWRLLTLISRSHEFLHIREITCQYNMYGDSFADYLGGRYEIPASASVVFERNKAHINWDAWMHFKTVLDNKIRDASALSEYRYKNIEGMYNFLVQKTELVLDGQRTILAELNKSSSVHLNLYDNHLALHNKVDQGLSTLMGEAETISNRLDAIDHAQAEMMNRLSVTERIKSLARKFKRLGR